MLLRCYVIVYTFLLCSFVHAQNAPVTTAPGLYHVTPGEVTVPVIVNGFDEIGAISLSLDYDPQVMTFIQGIQNNALNGPFDIGFTILPTGNHRLVIGWFGNAVSLPDGTSLIDLKFNFTGGTTQLLWFDNGSSCEYGDGAYNTLNDSPYDCYYVNGIVTSDKSLNLSLLLEGLYNPVTHRMNSPLGFSSGPCSDGIADNIEVELHSATDYSNIVFTFGMIGVSMLGESKLLIPSSLNDSYYITVRHRNSIATVSASPVSFAGNMISYDFTDLASKAFANNMKQMADGKWAFFAGDVNQDGAVDTADMSPVDNDASVFAGGYLVTDVNGDDIVDTADMTLVDNNGSVFVGSATP